MRTCTLDVKPHAASSLSEKRFVIIVEYAAYGLFGVVEYIVGAEHIWYTTSSDAGPPVRSELSSCMTRIMQLTRL